MYSDAATIAMQPTRTSARAQFAAAVTEVEDAVAPSARVAVTETVYATPLISPPRVHVVAPVVVQVLVVCPAATADAE